MGASNIPFDTSTSGALGHNAPLITIAAVVIARNGVMPKRCRDTDVEAAIDTPTSSGVFGSEEELGSAFIWMATPLEMSASLARDSTSWGIIAGYRELKAPSLMLSSIVVPTRQNLRAAAVKARMNTRRMYTLIQKHWACNDMRLTLKV